MTRRALFVLLLRSCFALLLVHAQIDAVLHDLHHLAERAAHPEQGPAGSHLCAKCVALAPVHGAASNGTAVVPILPYDQVAFVVPTYAFSPRVVVPFDSQGPPVLDASVA